MKTDTKIYATSIVAIVLLVGAMGLVFVVADDTPSENITDAPSSSDPLPQKEKVTIDEAPESVQNSMAVAQTLKDDLHKSDDFGEATVSINKDGIVIVTYNSTSTNGDMIKKEMGEVALRYSDAVAEHNESSGAVIAANGIQLTISQEAAIAHSQDRLNDEAYRKTFHWSTYGQ